jgi:hypothetical protein
MPYVYQLCLENVPENVPEKLRFKICAENVPVFVPVFVPDYQETISHFNKMTYNINTYKFNKL